MPGPEVMKRMLLITALLLAPLSLSATQYYAVENEWLFIPVTLPEGKVGGGDFYNLQFEPAGDKSINVEYQLRADGVQVRAGNAGIYQFRLIVNHVVKSSCAGVAVREYSKEPIEVHITR